jgi:ABC-type protease/lipase transport system fused ATPase/permease subunit
MNLSGYPVTSGGIRDTRSTSELQKALASCRQAFIGVGLFSGLINVLYLTGPLFMLEIYDRVIPSRSIPTLVGLVVLVAVLFAFMGVLDFIRGLMFNRIAGVLDQRLGQRVFGTLAALPLKTRSTADGLQPLRDLDQVRSFLSSGGPLALFDLPWMPLYVARPSQKLGEVPDPEQIERPEVRLGMRGAKLRPTKAARDPQGSCLAIIR